MNETEAQTQTPETIFGFPIRFTDTSEGLPDLDYIIWPPLPFAAAEVAEGNATPVGRLAAPRFGSGDA